MTDLRANAQLALAKLPPEAQQQHHDAWERIEARVIAKRAENARDYEVKHAVEHARQMYYTELLNGSTAQDCERIVGKALWSSVVTSATEHTGNFVVTLAFSDGSQLVERYRNRQKADHAAYGCAMTYRGCTEATLTHNGRRLATYTNNLL